MLVIKIVALYGPGAVDDRGQPMEEGQHVYRYASGDNIQDFADSSRLFNYLQGKPWVRSLEQYYGSSLVRTYAALPKDLTNGSNQPNP